MCTYHHDSSAHFMYGIHAILCKISGISIVVPHKTWRYILFAVFNNFFLCENIHNQRVMRLSNVFLDYIFVHGYTGIFTFCQRMKFGCYFIRYHFSLFIQFVHTLLYMKIPNIHCCSSLVYS